MVKKDKSWMDSWVSEIDTRALSDNNLPDRDSVVRHELRNGINMDMGYDMKGDTDWEADIEVNENKMVFNPGEAFDTLKNFQEKGTEGFRDINSVDSLLEIVADAEEVPKNTRRIGYEAVAIEEAMDDYERVRNWGFGEDQYITVEELLKPVGYQEKRLFDGVDTDGVRREGRVCFDLDEEYEDLKINGNDALQLIPHTIGLLNWRKHADGREEAGVEINFDVEVDDEEVCLHIYDNGPGIDLEETSKEELKQYSEGSGIGIPFGNELVRMAGGSLEIGSRESYDGRQGAYLKVMLPRFSQ